MYVLLLIDEIYVNRVVTFKAQNIVGFAENKPKEVAKTVTSFMITFCLIPVNGLTGSELQKIL